jgi:hypothetical protein
MDAIVRTHLKLLSNQLHLDILDDFINNPTFFIVLTDGTPDDICFGLIASYLDNELHGLITKSKQRRCDAINMISEYLSQNISTIIFVIDQENESLEFVYDHISKKLREKGLINESLQQNNKLKRYSCSLGKYSYQVISVINGLDQVATDKHCIEDHFITSAEIDPNGDSKGSWNSLTSREKLEKYRDLLNNDNIRKFFPQQVCSIDILK